MNDVFVIKGYEEKDSVLMINSKTADKVGLGYKKRAFVAFGVQKYYVDVVISDEVQENYIQLSSKTIGILHLPDYIDYEIRVKDNEIIIGPYIGLLVSEDANNITKGRLRDLKIFSEQYSRLHGALVVFALNKVDMSNRLIEGYCYNPQNDSWQVEILPYPSAIYRTIGLSEFWQNHFLSNIGDRLFNNHFFGKWEMYKWFSSEADFKHYIPYTMLYKSYRDVLDMVETYGRVFIKPVSGLRGIGIVEVSQNNKLTIIRYRENGVNHELSLSDSREIINFIKERFRSRRYLIQQAIDLLEYDGGKVDFRCALQKNQANEWVCNEIFGKCGEKGSIVSNVSNGGTAFTGINLLKRILPLYNMNVLSVTQRMESFAIKVAYALDRFGINCGTIGLDIGLDVRGCMWLIEINNRDPSPGYALAVNNGTLYSIIKTSPIFYAKSLAGFGLLR